LRFCRCSLSACLPPSFFVCHFVAVHCLAILLLCHVAACHLVACLPSAARHLAICQFANFGWLPLLPLSGVAAGLAMAWQNGHGLHFWAWGAMFISPWRQKCNGEAFPSFLCDFMGPSLAAPALSMDQTCRFPSRPGAGQCWLPLAPRASFAVALVGVRSASASWVPLASDQEGQMPIAVGRIPCTPLGGAWARTRIHRILIGLDASFFYPRAGSERPYMRKGLAGASPRAFFVGCWRCFIPSILPHDLPHGGCGQYAKMPDSWGTFEGSAMSSATPGQGCLDWI